MSKAIIKAKATIKKTSLALFLSMFVLSISSVFDISRNIAYATATLPTGGAITTFVGNGTNGINGTTYRVHTFTGNGTFDTQGNAINAQYLLVGGGGGGGGVIDGGGGGGEVLDSTGTIASGTHAVTIGNGGLGGTGWNTGANMRAGTGGSTTIATLTARGGGGGGGYNNANHTLMDGGSGGGGTSTNTGSMLGGETTAVAPGLGNKGGDGAGDSNHGAGGGGAGAIGSDASTGGAGDGGEGVQSSIPGTTRFYGGGGGGGKRNGSAGLSGNGTQGGGGRGGVITALPVAYNAGALAGVATGAAMHGEANTGGGGGGAGYHVASGSRIGGTGGSGIAVIRYSISTLSFDGNTNTSGANPATQVDLLEGESTTTALQGTLSKTGYNFTGWNTLADGSGTAYAAGDPFTATSTNTTLYAQWTANTYTVSFDGNTSDGGATADQSFTYDAAQNLTTNGYTKTGYTFAGWNASSDGSGTAYTDAQSINNLTDVDGDTVTLYAQWTVNQYTIDFQEDGGTTVADITADYGSTIINPADPTRTGYTFAGWSPAIPGTMPAANTTVTAQWTLIDSLASTGAAIWAQGIVGMALIGIANTYYFWKRQSNHSPKV